MSTQQLQLVYSNSTFANFSAWAAQMSDWFANAGWLQGTDTGQVMWTGLSITVVSMSGTNMTCTYTSLSGLALRVGRTLTITGWTGGNTGNNGTFRITTLGSGTFTCVNASGVNVASGGTGVVTINSAVPGANAFVYEIWTPGDGGTTFNVKMEYGNPVSGTNSPGFRVSIGTTTDGAGTLSGLTTTATANGAATTSPSASTQYECDFSGANNRIAMMMWRNTGVSTSPPQVFAIERSVDSTGAVTNSYITMWVFGYGTASTVAGAQQSILFGTGAATRLTMSANATLALLCRSTNSGTAAFNNAIPLDLASPLIGYWDFPCTSIGVAPSADITEGVTFTATWYSATRTYMPTKNAAVIPALNAALCMRYD